SKYAPQPAAPGMCAKRAHSDLSPPGRGKDSKPGKGRRHKGGLAAGKGSLPQKAETRGEAPSPGNLRKERANSDPSSQAGRGEEARPPLFKFSANRERSFPPLPTGTWTAGDVVRP